MVRQLSRLSVMGALLLMGCLPAAMLSSTPIVGPVASVPGATGRAADLAVPNASPEGALYLPLVRQPGSTLLPAVTATLTPPASGTPGTVIPSATPGTTTSPTSTPVASATPTTVTATVTATRVPLTWWLPSPDKPIAWHWQLSQPFVFPRDVIPHVTVYDVDGELTSAATVAQLHSLGPAIIVICYFDAGVYEDYRSDTSSFPPEVIGNPDVGWDGSYWLDIRQVDILRPIMENRIKTWCKDKGFDAIEPDETEVWSNDSGFPITKAQNNTYNQMIAALGHKYGLSVGLKGNTTETGELVDYFDWTLNEQCWEFDECDFVYSSFVVHGKAAFNVEYDASPDCAQANLWHINSARRDLDLVGPTDPVYDFTPCVPYTQTTWP